MYIATGVIGIILLIVLVVVSMAYGNSAGVRTMEIALGFWFLGSITGGLLVATVALIAREQ